MGTFNGGTRGSAQISNTPDLVLRLRKGAERRCESTCTECVQKFAAIVHYSPLVGHYARIPRAQQNRHCQERNRPRRTTAFWPSAEIHGCPLPTPTGQC